MRAMSVYIPGSRYGIIVYKQPAKTCNIMARIMQF